MLEISILGDRLAYLSNIKIILVISLDIRSDFVLFKPFSQSHDSDLMRYLCSKPVMINKLEKLVIPFAVMVTICGMESAF